MVHLIARRWSALTVFSVSLLLPASLVQAAPATLAEVPLTFEANRGQAAPDVRFIARAPGYAVQLTRNELRLLVRGDRKRAAFSHGLRFTWLGANPDAQSVPESRQQGIVNYFKGSDPTKWRIAIPTFARVRQASMYSGIDLEYYGNGKTIEYDLIVRPHADPSLPRISVEGAAEVRIAKSGDLDLVLSDGKTIRLKAPVAYQETRGLRSSVHASYCLTRSDGGTEVGFEVAEYDRELPLVIDPLVYSTFLGGNADDDGTGIAVNAAGEAFVTGVTADATIDFPTTAGAFDETHDASIDAFVMRLNASGTGLIYSTYLGGSADDSAAGIALNAAGEAFIAGTTSSGTFPTTPGAYDSSHNGSYDAFVTRLNATGSALIYSTFLGSGSNDFGNAIAINGDEAFVTGRASNDAAPFPTTAGAYDTGHNGAYDVFVTRLTAAGDALVYSTFLGGAMDDYGIGIAVSAGGDAFITGLTINDTVAPIVNFPVTPGAFDTLHNGGASDAFVTRLAADGSALVYSTFLGSSNFDEGRDVAVNAAGEAFATGYAVDVSGDFPTTAGAYDVTPNGGQDVYVTRLNAAGSALMVSTLIGSSGDDEPKAIVLNAASEAYVAGRTKSAGFPTTVGAADTTHNSPTVEDAFVLRLNATFSTLVYSTFLGGSGIDEAHDVAVNGGDAYVTGVTADDATDFPATAGAFGTSHSGARDAFAAKVRTGYSITITAGSNGSGLVTGGGLNCTIAGATASGICSALFADTATATLVATPSTGSSFSGWSGDPDCSDGDVTVDGEKTCTANFVLDTFLFTITKSGNGSGTVIAPGIDCGADCDQTYNYGTVIPLGVILDTGSTIAGWGGDPDCADFSVTIDATKTCTANLVLQTFALSVMTAGTGTGTISSEPAGIDCGSDCTHIYDYGTVVTLTPSPAIGSTFTGWTGDPDCSDGIVSMSSSQSCTASFALQTFPLTVTTAGSGSGSVTSMPEGITCPADCSESFPYATAVTLTATPSTGSTFTGWSGDADCSDGMVAIVSAANCTATFTLQTFALNVATIGAGSGSVSSTPAGIDCGTDCMEIFDYGTVVTLNAVPATGSTFTGWSGDPDCADGAIAISGLTSCTATFALQSLTLTVATAGSGSGTITSAPPGIACGVDCAEGFDFGTIVMLTAAPAAGSSFGGWSGDPDCSDGSVTIDGAKSCTATFTLQTFPLNVTTTGSGTGTVTSTPAGIDCGADCTEIFDYGTAVSLNAVPAAGSTFTGWSGDPDCADGSVAIDSARSCTATFTLQTFQLLVNRTGSGGGTVTSSPAGIDCGADCAESYGFNTSVTLTPLPDPGSTFSGWTGDADCSDGVITISAATTCTATFVVAPGNAIPTLSTWAMLLMAAALMAIALKAVK
jgi:hypothetical protein